MPRILKTALILILVALSIAASAQTASPTPTQFDSIKKVVLDNGLTILVRSEPGSRLVAVSAMVRAGTSEETIMNAGTGYYVSQLLLASTVVSSADKVATIADSVGGNLSSQWNSDYTELKAVTTSTMFNETISLMAECLMQADFDKSWVERTRSDLIRQMLDDTAPPFEKTYMKLKELLYQDNGYRRLPYGLERVIRTVSPEDLRRFHTTYYVPNNTVVAVVGDVTPELAVERVKLAFAGWVAKPLPKRLPVPDETMDMFRSSVAEADTEVAYLMVGWLAPSVKSSDFAAVSVAGNALGGGKGSLMFRRLRQEMGMGYEIGTTYPRLRNQSHLMAYVATDPFKFDPQYGGPSVVIDEVKTNLLKMVDELKTSPLTDKDLQRAKGYTIGQFAMTHQHLAERASDLAWFETVGVGYDMYQRFPDEIEKVTAADILRVVRTYLDKYAVVVLLPKGRPTETP